MGFIAFIVVMAALANFIGDLSDFIADYKYWIGIAIAALAGFKYVRGWWEQKEAEHKKALEEEERKRMIQAAAAMVNLDKKKKGLGDDVEEDGNSYFSNSIQHMSK